MKKTAFILIVLTILSKFMGFGREIALAYFYGVTGISDAYIIALTIPTVIFAFIGSGISTAYIPLFTKIENERGSLEANEYTNNLINGLLLVCTVFVILGLLFTKQIVSIFASGFQGETLELAIKFTKISIFGMFFTSVIQIFSAFLQIKGNYVVPALIGLPLNTLIILSMYISSHGNTNILAIGIVLATFSQFLFLIPSVIKNKFKYKITLNLNDPNVKNMFYLALPVILGVAVNDLNAIIDKTLASQVATGGISALNYAQRLNGFVQGIIVLSVSTAIYPLISKMAAENDLENLKSTISEAVNSINLLVIPCAIGAMTLSVPIIKILFGRGAFDDTAITMTSSALFFYSMGMVGIGIRQLLSRPFYAMQDTKTPVINATIGVILNIILNIVLSKFMGISGLALATSISATVTAILMFVSLRKKIGQFGLKKITISFIKILFAGFCMGLITHILFNYLINRVGLLMALSAAIAFGAILYGVIILFMKIEEVDLITNKLVKRRRHISEK